MYQGSYQAPPGLLRIEECLDADGGIVLPPGVNLLSLIDRNIANVGDSVAYRYLDFTMAEGGRAIELTWSRLGERMRAIAARLQTLTGLGERVAILAPQGVDYVAAFFATIKAGNIAVPLFAPELPGHAERLDTALRDCSPTVVVTTAAALTAVNEFLRRWVDSDRGPAVVVIDDIPDSEGDSLVPIEVDVDDVSHLQYTSGATRAPVGVEITHRAVGTNLLQMILSIDLLDRNTHGVSWLPLYHDMGLSMIGFPAVYGGHSTLMSPAAFLRRPQRWINALSAESRNARVVTAAPNFAYEWTAARGRPDPGDDTDLEKIDLEKVALIIGSEPVSVDAMRDFTTAFAPFGLPPTAFKPSYGIAEATLFVSTIGPADEPTVTYFDRRSLESDDAVVVPAGHQDAVAHVACGTVARSQWAAIVDTDLSAELPDGKIGEIWLHGNNIGRGYWNRPADTAATFGAELNTVLDTGHTRGVPADARWLRTGDLGLYHGGQLYITGRRADLLVINGRHLYPQHLEHTAAEASTMVRRGYVAAFTVGAAGGEPAVVIVAERAAGTARADAEPELAAVRAAVLDHHGVPVADTRLVPAGAIPRTTSGKLARRACRAEYLAGVWGTPGVCDGG